ncbi:unnamed protein product [Symbiodinium sp. KB8]|nr:unnamed protein product [Symbiodinium sp. KB8]
MELLAEAANALAQAEVPCDIAEGVALTRMTATRKPGGGVRGIATGDMFRRLVSRSLAATWAPVFDQATRPYQFALRTRAGVGALTARLRATLENDAHATVVSVAGRAQCLRLHFPCRVPEQAARGCTRTRALRAPLLWPDFGVRHGIRQALCRADSQLRQGEHAGLSANLGKTRVFNYDRVAPRCHGSPTLGPRSGAAASLPRCVASSHSAPRRSTSAHGTGTRCSASFPDYLTYSVRGSSSASAPRPAPTRRFGRSHMGHFPRTAITAPAAYWAAWADAFNVLRERLPAKQLALKGGQQWLVNTTAPGVAPDDRKRPLGGALCCDATLVSPLTRAGGPHSGAATHRMAQSCAPPCAAQTRHLP